MLYHSSYKPGSKTGLKRMKEKDQIKKPMVIDNKSPERLLYGIMTNVKLTSYQKAKKR